MNKLVLISALLASVGVQAAQAASVEAFANATVQPAGPRTGSSGTNYFNIEGSDNGGFASYGVARFDLAAMKADFDALYGAGGWRVDNVVLELTQSNAGFTTDGGVQIYFTGDDAVSIANDGTSPLSHPFAGDFADALLVKSYAFTEIGSGTVENHTLYLAGGANGAGGLSLAANILADNLVTLALVDADAAVAATYAGHTNSSYAGPTLSVSVAAVPEPETYALMLAGLGLVGALARRRMA
ncbi:MAG: PEP-CTERM sorting domain-containing protein [Thiobacillus sp.]|nr:PEP-CTERM sorting domain-containing protein [Thiobacillus sp.]